MRSPRNNEPRIDERFSCFRLRLARSRIHRFGVFAAETIPAQRKVIEYTGERISRRESRRRYLKALESHGKPLLYLFRVDERWVIDGRVGGSGAEYINHSCAPNLRARVEEGHANFWSRRRIEAGEELTIDYQFPRKGQKIRCSCGASNCRGTLNLK
jgi:SET domain-containing protein